MEEINMENAMEQEVESTQAPEEIEASTSNEKERAEQETGAAEPPVRSDEWFARDSERFDQAYPELDKQTLFADGDFLAYAEGKIGVTPLKDIYEGYVTMKNNLTAKAREKAARAASTGSLKQSAKDADAEYYTLAEMQAMSAKYIEEHWDKVQRSLKRLR